MSELANKIKGWLEKQGYPLEMFVAQKFKEQGFKIAQSVYYKDDETGKSREIDVIAYYSYVSNGVWFNLTFVIECKLSKDKPWVIFNNDDLFTKKDFIRERYGTKNAKKLIELIIEKEDIEELTLIGKNKSNSGYAVTQAFTEGVDITYSALNGVNKSIQYFVGETNKTRRRMCNIYFPIIVIDGKLFECELSESGETLVSEIKENDFTWIKSYDTHSLIQVSITTKENFETFVQKLKSNCEIFIEKYKDEMNWISENQPTNKN